MHRKLFVSTITIVVLTLLLSLVAIEIAVKQQFSHYLTSSTEASLEQITQSLMDSYQKDKGWNEKSLEGISHSLPMDVKVIVKDPQGKSITALESSMQQQMMHGNMMGEMSDPSAVEWNTKLVKVTSPEGLITIAELAYPTNARIVHPVDVSFMREILKSLLLAGSISLVIAIVLSFWISQRLSRPLRRLTLAVERIGAGNLDERVAISGTDEVANLLDAFNSMAKNLKKQEHFRKQFTADIAHELRTPLTSIKSYIEAFIDGVLPANKDNLTILNEEIDRLVNLASDLKDLNVAELSSLNPEFLPINILEILDRVISNLQPLVQEKGLDLIWEPPNTELYVDGDQYLLTRLFYNIIHNSYKYTSSDGIIRIGLDAIDNVIVAKISDTGIGIHKDDIPYIFERFYRADKSRTRETGGNGIGLALAHEIVVLHNGTIEVASEPGKGTTFTIKLPLRQRN
ncbi:MAG: ATP-binding protein [Desulfitobacterium hafniense]|nr:ATP-binding protein [Desulfitobacterium hafniense]